LTNTFSGIRPADLPGFIVAATGRARRTDRSARHLAARAAPRKGTPYAELGLADPKWSGDKLIDFMIAHPILIQRPIVVTSKAVTRAKG
jgi:arsenate reductase